MKSKCKVYQPTNLMWHKAIYNLVCRGDLTPEQANKCYERIIATQNKKCWQNAQEIIDEI